MRVFYANNMTYNIRHGMTSHGVATAKSLGNWDGFHHGRAAVFHNGGDSRRWIRNCKRGRSDGIWQTEVNIGIQRQSPGRESGDGLPEARGGLNNLRRRRRSPRPLHYPFFSPFLFYFPPFTLRRMAP